MVAIAGEYARSDFKEKLDRSNGRDCVDLYKQLIGLASLCWCDLVAGS